MAEVASDSGWSEDSEIAVYLNLIIGAIQNFNNNAVRSTIKSLPISEISVEASDEWLRILLTQCTEEENKKAFEIVMQAWEDNNPEEDERPIRASLFRQFRVEERVYSYMLKIFKGDTIENYLEWISNFQRDEATYFATLKICRFFPKANYPQLLLNLTGRDDINPYVTKALTDLTVEKEDGVAPIPDWILPALEPKTHQQLVDDLRGSLPVRPDFESMSDAELEKLFRKQYQRIDQEMGGLKINTTKQGLYDSIAKSVKTERQETIRTLRGIWEHSLSHNVEIFRTFGPCHIQQDELDLNSNAKDPCRRYGGDRMLLCWHYANFDSDADAEIISDIEFEGRYEDVEWFFGKCDFCGKLIRARHYAVRMPMPGGGWRGCYCSIKCLKDSASNSCDGGENSQTRAIDGLYQILKTNGIYDRLWPVEEEQPEIESLSYYDNYSHILPDLEDLVDSDSEAPLVLESTFSNLLDLIEE